MTKSAAAFLFSCERFESQERGRGGVFCWTFTTPQTLESDRDYMRLWINLRKRLQREYPIRGLRVVEIHPGGHGLHVHAIMSPRLDVEEVRKIATGIGWGRINVFRARKSWSRYLAKHIRKHAPDEATLTRGVRSWSAFGFRANRVRDIQVDSLMSRNLRLWLEAHPGRVGYTALNWIRRQTILWGEMEEWRGPTNKLQYPGAYLL